MGEIRIRFRMNLETGKRDIVVEYDSDEDQLRHEHEQKHRDIVQKLVGEGVLGADEVGEVTVERVRGDTDPVTPESNAPEAEPQAGQG